MSSHYLTRRKRAASRREREEESSEEQDIAADLAANWSDTQEQDPSVTRDEPTAQIEEETQDEDSEDEDFEPADDEYGSDLAENMSEPSETQEPAMVLIGGESLLLAAHPNPVSAEVKPLYLKQDRYTMDASDRNALFKEAKKSILTEKFQQQSLTVTGDDILDDTVVLKDQLTKLMAHIKEYDMEDVFRIVEVSTDDPTKIVKQTNLLTHYSSLTPKKVAFSNQWRRRYLDQASQPWIEDNLGLTFELIRNNTADSLYGKAMESYEQFEASERGGPLFLAIILDHLQRNTEEQCLSLAARIRNMKITDYPGEDVSKVVTLLRAAIRRLTDANTVFTVEGEAMHKYLPTDLTKILLEIFQSSTVDEFNKIFSTLSTIRTVARHAAASNNDTDELTTEMILETAESEYTNFVSTLKWTGVTSPGKSSFTSAHQIRCWNCDEVGHGLNECTKPKHKDKIEQRRKAFNDARAKERASHQGSKGGRDSRGGRRGGVPVAETGKFAKPSRSEHYKRTIDGCLWKYDGRRKMWFKSGPQSAGQRPQAQAAALPSDVSAATQSTSTSTLTANTGSTPGTTLQPPTNVANISAEASRAQALRAAAAVRAQETASLLASQLREMDNLT
jgi:hypothetical protein